MTGIASRLVLALAALGLAAPSAHGAALLPGSAYGGKGGSGKQVWTLDVGVRPNARTAHVKVGLPMRCVLDDGTIMWWSVPFEFNARISSAGTVSGSWSDVKVVRQGNYKGDTTRQSVRVRGAFNGDRVALTVQGRYVRAMRERFQKCRPPRTFHMRATRYYPAYRTGSYAGTTDEGLPVGPVHVVYPGSVKGNEVFGVADRFALVARLSCYDGTRTWSEDRLLELPTGDRLALVWSRSGHGFDFDGIVGDLQVKLRATFGSKLTGYFSAAPPGGGRGCRGEGDFSATWQAP